MRRALVWSGLAVLLWGCGSESTPSATVGNVEPQDAESVQDAEGEISLADPGPEETTVEPDADIQEAEVAPTQDVTEEVLELPVEPDVVEPEPDLFAQGHKPQFAIQIPPALLESLEESWEESVETTVTIDGETLAGVGLTLVKFDKNVPSIAGKPRIHLQFDAVDPAQRFQGYRGLWLHELSKDGSKVAEVLGYSLFQASELPAPRAAHAWVQINEEDRGLYVALEPYGDPVFVQRYAESLDAPVYSAPSKLDLVHDQLESFQLEHGVDEERAQLKALSEALDAIESEPPDDVLGALGAVFDLEAYLSFAAIEVILGHKQGYTQNRQRYALLRGDDGRWRFIPYGIDRIFKGNVKPLQADGRVHKLCMNNLACRWAVADAYAEVAERIEAMGLADQVDAARPYVLAMAEADPFIEDPGAVGGALDFVESFLTMNPGWVDRKSTR